MFIVLTFIHIVVCLFLVVVVLLQSGKAADIAGAFGGMGSQTAFGPRGSATVLSKATTVAAALFMVTSLTLAITAMRRSGASTTVLEKQGSQAQPTAPAQPGQAPAGGQPSVTFTPEGGGQSTTVPITLPPQPGQQTQTPAGQKSPPAGQTPAQQQAPKK